MGHIPGAVHRAEFAVDMINAIAFKKHPRTAHVIKGFIQKLRHLLRRQHQIGQCLRRHIKRIAGVVLLRDHDRKTVGIRENREKGEVVFIFPHLMAGGFPLNNLAENTAHQHASI